MTPTRSSPHRRLAIAILALVVAIAALLRAELAYADRVDDLIVQLDDSSEKVRLSAVLNLTKLGDPRAIDPLIQRLKKDGEKSVRSTAASGLGQLVTAKVPADVRERATKALDYAANNDANPSVQAQAERALKVINALATPTTSPPPSGGGGVYVNIGPMSSKTNTPRDPKYRADMIKTATKTMNKAAGNYPTTWPGGGVPTKAALTQKAVQGFYVDGTLNDVTVKTSGSSATISCKVSMLLASFPDKSVFGFLNGAANVQGSSSQRDIDLASDDCVAAVVEDLIAKKIVPTISAKTGITPVKATP